LGRRGISKILRKEAEEIAKKLKAVVKPGGSHDIATVWADGKLIGHFGISRSRKAGHNHIPSQIYVSQTKALKLAKCTMSYDEYVDELRQNNKI